MTVYGWSESKVCSNNQLQDPIIIITSIMFLHVECHTIPSHVFKPKFLNWEVQKPFVLICQYAPVVNKNVETTAHNNASKKGVCNALLPGYENTCYAVAPTSRSSMKAFG